MDRDYEYRRGDDWGRGDYGPDWDAKGESGWRRDPGYGYGRGAYDSGRDWEREDFMLQRRGYGAARRQDWAGDYAERRFREPEGGYDRPGGIYGSYQAWRGR